MEALTFALSAAPTFLACVAGFVAVRVQLTRLTDAVESQGRQADKTVAAVDALSKHVAGNTNRLVEVSAQVSGNCKAVAELATDVWGNGKKGLKLDMAGAQHAVEELQKDVARIQVRGCDWYTDRKAKDGGGHGQ